MTADNGRGFIRREHLGTPYVVFVPHAYQEGRPVPAVLFLHGAGETGDDGERQAGVGLGPAIRRQEKDFPFLAIFPQSRQRSWMAASPDAAAAIQILDSVARDYRIDATRMHLTGISMGGYGTWGLAAKYPDRWASIVPICGGGDPLTAPTIKHIACWCFHGAADEIIPVEQSRQMVGALRTAGGDPRYTEYADVGHNSWDHAYGTRELWEWMAAQHR